MIPEYFTAAHKHYLAGQANLELIQEHLSGVIAIRIIDDFLSIVDPEFYLRYSVAYNSQFTNESLHALEELRRKVFELSHDDKMPSESTIFAKADEFALLPLDEIPAAIESYRNEFLGCNKDPETSSG